MKYIIAVVYSVSFLLLFSCDNGDGGTLSSDSRSKQFSDAADKPFVEISDGLKEFLTQQHRQFSSNEGLNFAGGPSKCSNTTITVDGEDFTLTSAECSYRVWGGYNLETFYVGGSTIIDGFYATVGASFTNIGIPSTGSYSPELRCDLFCYNTVELAMVIYINGSDGSEYFGAPNPELFVSNTGERATVTFDETFYSWQSFQFRCSGSIACCN